MDHVARPGGLGSDYASLPVRSYRPTVKPNKQDANPHGSASRVVRGYNHHKGSKGPGYNKMSDDSTRFDSFEYFDVNAPDFRVVNRKSRGFESHRTSSNPGLTLAELWKNGLPPPLIPGPGPFRLRAPQEAVERHGHQFDIRKEARIMPEYFSTCTCCPGDPMRFRTVQHIRAHENTPKSFQFETDSLSPDGAVPWNKVMPEKVFKNLVAQGILDPPALENHKSSPLSGSEIQTRRPLRTYQKKRVHNPSPSTAQTDRDFGFQHFDFALDKVHMPDRGLFDGFYFGPQINPADFRSGEVGRDDYDGSSSLGGSVHRSGEYSRMHSSDGGGMRQNPHKGNSSDRDTGLRGQNKAFGKAMDGISMHHTISKDMTACEGDRTAALFREYGKLLCRPSLTLSQIASRQKGMASR